jgi:pimeloyl-ACP methyl ester carboxylesterase
MNFGFRTTTIVAAVAVCLALGEASPALAQPPAGRGGGRGAGGFIQSSDPRVQNRTYKFADTDEELPYCVFVSSKVAKDRKAPLVISLHGLGIGPGFMCQGKAIDLAEAGGYILAAPMGYNPGGWYGSPVIGGPRGRGAAATPPPANLPELSEKDAMNVLAMMRKEFNVDDSRTYLIGHSMGGAGTLFLGSKHAKEWAALAAMAPASFGMNNTRAEILQRIEDGNLPLFIAHGDADELVPVTNSRMWVETMKELKMNYEYKEYPGVTHGPIIEAAMPDIFAFLAKHSKSGR